MKTPSIKKNYIMNTAYQVLNLIIPLITTPYISRIFDADGIGIYSYTLSIASFFVLFAILGRTAYAQRVIAQCRDDRKLRSKNFWEIELVSLISTFLSVVLWIIMILAYKSYSIYFWVLTIEIVASLFDITWFFAGLERFSVIVVRNIIIKFATVILLFVLIKEKSDLILYIAMLSASKLLGNLSMWFTLRKEIDFMPLKELKIKNHIKETIAYFIPTIAASVYTQLDKAMITWITDESTENGYYEQAHKIINLAYTVVISLNTVMASRISYLFAVEKYDEIKERLEQAAAFILTLAVPITFGICGISEKFVPYFFGSGYEKVITLLCIGSPLVVILSLHNFIAAQYLVPSGKRAKSTKGVFIGAGVNFTLNMILIPVAKSTGAIIASIIGEISVCIVYFAMSREYVPVKTVLKYFPKRIISGALMFVCIYFIGRPMPEKITTTVIQVTAGVIIYFSLLIIMKDKVTINFCKTFLSKIKK